MTSIARFYKLSGLKFFKACKHRIVLPSRNRSPAKITLSLHYYSWYPTQFLPSKDICQAAFSAKQPNEIGPLSGILSPPAINYTLEVDYFKAQTGLPGRLTLVENGIRRGGRIERTASLNVGILSCQEYEAHIYVSGTSSSFKGPICNYSK